MSKECAFNWIEDNSFKIIKISDKIWEFAELGLKEFKSFKLLADELEKNGFKVTRGVADMPTAFIATWGSGNPVIGITGEYDALPNLSQKPIPVKETLIENAPGHACGHNIHGTSGMAGAIGAKIAMEKNGINGTIKFFGSPAEETYDGKAFMVRDGLFNGVDAVLGHHPGSVNTAGLSGSLAMNGVRFVFHGIASHAAGAPERGRSALDAVEIMNIGINYMREHIIDKARVHYIIEKGGNAPNIVPSYASSWYYIRAPYRDQVDSIYEWVLKIKKGAELITDTTSETIFDSAIYNKIPNKTLSELVVANMREIGSPTYTEEELNFAHEISKTIPREQKLNSLRNSKRPGWEKLIDVELDRSIVDAWNEGEVGSGSSDMGDVSWQAPTLEFSTATYALGTPGHSWQIVAQSKTGIGHKSLIFAAKVISGTVIELLLHPELIKKSKEELKERLAGQIYKPVIPYDHKPPNYN